MNRDRRRFLGLLAGAVGAGAAGCLGGTESAPTDDSGSTPTRTPAPSAADTRSTAASPTSTATDRTDSASSPREGGALVLERVDPTEAHSMTVYSVDLAETLRRAARTDGAVRTHGETHVYAPRSVVPALDTVELDAPDAADDEVGGVYDVTVDTGIRYELLVTAEAVSESDESTVTGKGDGATPDDDETPPAPDEVIPVADLPEDRRHFALAAIGDERATVYPETELGEWVREAFFGGYFEHDGTVYRGREQQQTDAAFFSTEVWYVLSLDPVDGAAETTLRLRDVDSGVRSVVDGLLESRTKEQTRVESEYRGYDAAVEGFAADTDAILTHVDAFSVAVER